MNIWKVEIHIGYILKCFINIQLTTIMQSAAKKQISSLRSA